MEGRRAQTVRNPGDRHQIPVERRLILKTGKRFVGGNNLEQRGLFNRLYKNGERLLGN